MKNPDLEDAKTMSEIDDNAYRMVAARAAKVDKTLAKKLEKVADSAKEVVDYIKTREG